MLSLQCLRKAFAWDKRQLLKPVRWGFCQMAEAKIEFLMPRDYEKRQKQGALGLNSRCASERQIENFWEIHCDVGPIWAPLTIFYRTTLKSQFIPDTSPHDFIWIYLGLCVFICLGFVIVLFHTFWRLSFMQLWLASSLLYSWGEPWSLDRLASAYWVLDYRHRLLYPIYTVLGMDLNPWLYDC